MRISNNCNTTFTGYKNILSADNMNSGCRLTVLAGELDNKGTQDLAEYHKLGRLAARFDIEPKDKNFVLMHLSAPSGASMSLNNTVLYTGRHLKELRTIVPDDIFKPQEAAALKAYTLFASITRRLGENNKAIVRDNGMAEVAGHVYSVLTKYTNSPEKALLIIRTLFSDINNIVPVSDVAKVFNKHIAESLKHYF